MNPSFPVLCRTNLDLHNERWPDFMMAIPRIGDEIRSLTRHGDFRLSLEVVKVTWEPRELDFKQIAWWPEIELHMTRFQRKLPSETGEVGSIRAFYEWYAKLTKTHISNYV